VARHLNDTHLYLVRHAHAAWQPDEDRPLSTRGAADAIVLADRLQHLPISFILSSPSRRALQTVEPLSRRLGLEPVIEPDLRERALLSPSADEFREAVKTSWRNPEAAAAGGESNAAAKGRGIAVLSRVLDEHAGRSAVISTHGNLFALMLQGFDPAVDYDFWLSLTFPDVYQLTFRGRALVAVRRIPLGEDA
jgi:2,3-bisphosphoglycerate-dependent phosphoglycerate mutase